MQEIKPFLKNSLPIYYKRNRPQCKPKFEADKCQYVKVHGFGNEIESVVFLFFIIIFLLSETLRQNRVLTYRAKPCNYFD